jgi:hypothetical protein
MMKPVLILDWDDTLLPSSWLNKVVPSDDIVLSMLDDLEHKLANLLTGAVLKLGLTVIIVTNAEEGWVEHSCGRYLPKLLQLLSGIRIVSARTAYGTIFPNSPSQVSKICFLVCEFDVLFQESCYVSVHQNNLEYIM